MTGNCGSAPYSFVRRPPIAGGRRRNRRDLISFQGSDGRPDTPSDWRHPSRRFVRPRRSNRYTQKWDWSRRVTEMGTGHWLARHVALTPITIQICDAFNYLQVLVNTMWKLTSHNWMDNCFGYWCMAAVNWRDYGKTCVVISFLFFSIQIIFIYNVF